MTTAASSPDVRVKRRRFARSSLAMLLCGLAGPQIAAAQGEPSDCPAAVAEASRASSTEEISLRLTRCAASGPPALTQLWLRPGSRSNAQRDALVEVSASLRDARLFRVVSEIGSRADRPTAERLAALRVLLRYFDPSFVPTDADLLSDSRDATFRQRSDVVQPVVGSVPLLSDVRRQIAVQLAAIARADVDPAMRQAALHARQVLAFADPANVPVEQGAIALVAGCGDRVTLRSTADIDLPVIVSVLGTSFRNNLGIRSGTAANPSEILFGLPPGTVVATLGGRELARLSQRTAPCAPGQVRTGPAGSGG